MYYEQYICTEMCYICIKMKSKYWETCYNSIPSIVLYAIVNTKIWWRKYSMHSDEKVFKNKFIRNYFAKNDDWDCIVTIVIINEWVTAINLRIKLVDKC